MRDPAEAFDAEPGDLLDGVGDAEAGAVGVGGGAEERVDDRGDGRGEAFSTIRSVTGGIASCRVPPSSFGMVTGASGCGR